MNDKRKGVPTYVDKRGYVRRLTSLQEKILYYRMEHPEMSLTQVTTNLNCSYTAVIKTTTNPACVAFEQEIKAMMDKRLIMGLEERQRRLSVHGRAVITDFVQPDGSITIDKDNPAIGAVAEYEVIETETATGRVTTRRKIKMHSPAEAIKQLDAEDGIGKPEPANINLAAIQINVTYESLKTVLPKPIDIKVVEVTQ